MSGCCDPRGCDRFFGGRFARRVAGRYRRRGLDRTAARMVAFLERQGIAGASVLEIGGGVGEIHLELLRRGARHAVNLELSPAYDAEAARLAAEAGVEGRVERRLHDIAVAPEAIAPADVVVLHRVVCCYPDYERLLGAAAARARRLVVFSHPRRNALSRLVVAAENLALRLGRREFRVFLHPPPAMLAILAEHGLEPAFEHRGVAWEAHGVGR
jgi:2-polyprenyl-3-methyl-5-hydroxy-6-metoxy-1,4-benzoquinol methylase